MTGSNKTIVEVAALTPDGHVPLGIMNTSQALDLPEHLDLVASHPDEEPGRTDKYVDRTELKGLDSTSS